MSAAMILLEIASVGVILLKIAFYCVGAWAVWYFAMQIAAEIDALMDRRRKEKGELEELRTENDEPRRENARLLAKMGDRAI